MTTFDNIMRKTAQLIREMKENDELVLDESKDIIYMVNGQSFLTFLEACEYSEVYCGYAASVIKTLSPSSITTPKPSKSLKKVGGILIFQKYEYSLLYKCWLDTIEEY
jgi:hypothetical protein